MSYKICLIGAGRRYSLVERFQQAGFDVFAVEKDENPPISKICNLLVDIPTDMLCIPLMDKLCYELSDLPNVITSTKTVNRICYDKVEFNKTFLRKPYYPAIDSSDDKIEHIQKPRYGYASKFIRKDHLFNLNDSLGDYIIQKAITGKEYTVDAYFDRSSQLIGTVARQRLRVADGEVVDAVTERKRILEEIIRDINTYLQYSFIGPVNFQFIQEDETRKPYLIEINARFGGGCILSLEAGFDMVDMIKREYFTNEPLPEYPVKYGLIMRRVYRETFFENYRV